MTDDIELKPCPFCGSRNIRSGEKMYWDDDGELPGVECLDCDSLARLDWWNRRIDAATESDERSR